MSVFGGIAPRFVKALYDATTSGRLNDALELQYKFSELYQIAKVEYPAPTKAMWEIMGRPVGVRLGCRTVRSRRTAKKRSGRRSKRSGCSTANRTAGRQHRTRNSNSLDTRETTMRKLLPAIVAAIGLLALASAPSLAQEWPTRGTIRLIVPYPAGGGTDVVARIVGEISAGAFAADHHRREPRRRQRPGRTAGVEAIAARRLHHGDDVRLADDGQPMGLQEICPMTR